MKKRRWIELALTWPSFGWLVFFFAIPTGLVFALSFKPADLTGGVDAGWTLATWRSLINPTFPLTIQIFPCNYAPTRNVVKGIHPST